MQWRDLVNWHETMHNARPAWIRFAVRWDMIELAPGTYSWYNTSTPTPSVYPSTTPLSYAYDFHKKYEVIQTQYPEAKMFVTIKIAPTAYRDTNFSTLPCTRLNNTGIIALANFINSMLSKYPNIRYLEIWNEPDADPDDMLDPTAWNYYGCWADKDTPSFGGDYYRRSWRRSIRG